MKPQGYSRYARSTKLATIDRGWPGKKKKRTVEAPRYTSSSGVISSTKWLGSELLSVAVEKRGRSDRIHGRKGRWSKGSENARIFAWPRRVEGLLFPERITAASTFTQAAACPITLDRRTGEFFKRRIREEIVAVWTTDRRRPSCRRANIVEYRMSGAHPSFHPVSLEFSIDLEHERSSEQLSEAVSSTNR